MSNYPPRRDSNSYSSKLQVRHGSILMHRRGVPQFNYQKNEKQFSTTPAPERSGLWAFPWPYKEPFLTEWKWDDVAPKEFFGHEEADEETGRKARDYLKDDDAQPWIAERRKRKDVLPWTRFWWQGEVYARFNERTDFDSDGALSVFSPYAGWYLLPLDLYVAALRKIEATSPVYGHDEMEVFLAEGRGKIIGRYLDFKDKTGRAKPDYEDLDE
jgi:FAD/FMN-containing dehydrogenase